MGKVQGLQTLLLVIYGCFSAEEIRPSLFNVTLKQENKMCVWFRRLALGGIGVLLSLTLLYLFWGCWGPGQASHTKRVF